MLALDAALSAMWAMEEQALNQILTIAARENVDVTPEALEAYRAKNLAGAERAQVRDGVAILGITGPLFRRANLFTAISGATSYDILRGDLQAAVDDPKVKAVLLNVDSPGGEVNGGNELAQAVHAVRGVKPIIAYVGGTGASMAYWLASAADRVVVDATARLGSIGVQVAFTEQGAKPGEKRYRFVSSQSPLKNADPATDAGATAMQATVDAIAQVFVEAVAQHRGVDTQTVLTKFGKGGTFVGQMAVEAGLADSVGTFEGALAELTSGRRPEPAKGAKMSSEGNLVAIERQRLGGLIKVARGFGASEADLTAAIDAGTTVEAFSVAQAEKVGSARVAGTSGFPGLVALRSTPPEVRAQDSEDAVLARILAA